VAPRGAGQLSDIPLRERSAHRYYCEFGS
jgi:hypothetical protein